MLAAASLLARYWPGLGARQDASLAVAGGLLRAGHGETLVADFIRAVATFARDEETVARVTAAEYTRRRLEGGLDATGWPTLSDIIDERIVKKVMAWVGAPSAPAGEMHSAALKEEASAERKTALVLPFKSAREVFMEGPVDVPWVVEAFVAEGALTEVDGKVKQSGKTTWLLYMCAAILDRKPFLGRKTCCTPIVFLTEQGRTAFKEALKRAGLHERDDLRVLFFKDVIGKPWEEVVAAAILECQRVGAKLLVVDTLPQFAGIPGDGENSSGEALKAVRPLQEAAMSHDLAVVFTRHERKSGGEVGEAGRGSSAFAGASDVILALRRPDAKSRPNARVIRSLSRFEETPDELVIELTEGGYRVLGNEKSLILHETRRRLVEALPRTEQGAMEMDDIVKLIDTPRTTIQEALKASLDEGEIKRTGGGKKRDPYRFFSI